jgi:hypothetical protein
MYKLETPPGDLGRLVEELRELDEEGLLQRWRRNCEALATPWQASRSLADQPMLRHYALRFVAIERFGVPGHVTRLREAYAAGG